MSLHIYLYHNQGSFLATKCIKYHEKKITHKKKKKTQKLITKFSCYPQSCELSTRPKAIVVLRSWIASFLEKVARSLLCQCVNAPPILVGNTTPQPLYTSTRFQLFFHKWCSFYYCLTPHYFQTFSTWKRSAREMC